MAPSWTSPGRPALALGDPGLCAATFVDYDNDGKQDCLSPARAAGNVLVRNLGNGKFKDVRKRQG